MSPHPQLIFIRLRCHLLPTVWTHIDVGIVTLRVLAIVPIIRRHLLPAIWTHIDVGIIALRVLAIVPIIGLKLRYGGQISIRRIVKRTIIA